MIKSGTITGSRYRSKEHTQMKVLMINGSRRPILSDNIIVSIKK